MDSREDTIKAHTSKARTYKAPESAGSSRTASAVTDAPAETGMSSPKRRSSDDLTLEYEKFFQAVASSPSSVVITDANGVIEYVNDRFVESTGYRRDQAVGRKPNLLKSGKTPAHVYDELWSTISAGKIWRGEICNRRRNGEYYWEATAIAPIFDGNGKPTHYVAVKEDVTARRNAEGLLRDRQERDAVLAQITQALLGEVTDGALGAALSELGACLKVDRAFLLRLSYDGQRIVSAHEWLAKGVQSHRETFEGLACEQFSWCLDHCRRGQALAVQDVNELPADADAFKALLVDGDIRASMTAPIMQAGELLGFVGVDVERHPRSWNDGDIAMTERVATVLGLALLRRDAEDELRTARDQANHAEQNLRDAIECLPEGFVLYDAQGNLEICNSRFRQDYGYGEDDVRPGTHFTDLGRLDIARGQVTVPDGYPDADTYLQSRLAYRTKMEGTFPVQLADGRHLMTRDRRTSSGGIVSIQTDITRIKKIEDALRISERKFWGVFHASPSLMSISGLADGRFLDVNARWSSAMGYDYTEVIGRTALELGVWPSMQAHKRMVEAFSADGILTNFEGQLKNRDGELRDYLMSGALVSIDGSEHLLLLCNDITERKAMERALKRSELEIRTILDSIVETFYRADAAGHMTMASASIETLLGYAPEEVLGKPVADLYCDPADRYAFLRALDQNGGQVRDYEVRLRRKDGGIIWAASNARYLYDRDENVIGLEGTTRDISAQKAAELEMFKAKEEAENANLAKTNFLSGMSHELRTPLNAVIGFSQMMELQKGATLTDQQREYIGIIRSSGEHLLSLINEVLDLAKVEAGRMAMRAAPTETTGLVTECVALVKPLATQRCITIEWHAPDGVPHVLVDRTKFKQILINLLSNAVKYNVDNGTVRVTLRRNEDSTLAISVTDTGKGMSPADCDALFEPFQRLSAEHSGIEGTGLGLVLAKRMVEAMGGSIHVESASGLGSTFTLTVPIATS
ncbi:MAG TPA: PAS domain S-box protein [Magnetovibrio sp.]